MCIMVLHLERVYDVLCALCDLCEEKRNSHSTWVIGVSFPATQMEIQYALHLCISIVYVAFQCYVLYARPHPATKLVPQEHFC